MYFQKADDPSSVQASIPEGNLYNCKVGEVVCITEATNLILRVNLSQGRARKVCEARALLRGSLHGRRQDRRLRAAERRQDPRRFHRGHIVSG